MVLPVKAMASAVLILGSTVNAEVCVSVGEHV